MMRSTSMRVLLSIALLGGLLQGTDRPAKAAFQVDIRGPEGSGAFGATVTALPGGNFVVTDPAFTRAGAENVGAVYLYHGASGTLISTLTGSTENDRVGSGGVTVLSNGNFVVRSPDWNNGAVSGVGAVTWGSGTGGVSGVVSSKNSLVGGKANDHVGGSPGPHPDIPFVTPLSNGNFVVTSPYWDNGSAPDSGAATWGSGASGVSGVVSPANSLVGGTTDDQVGYWGVTALTNGDYLVHSPDWHNGVAQEAGAVTWGDGGGGTTGAVSALNSLVGETAGDQVGGWKRTIDLGSGNYLVITPGWDNGPVVNAGAVTWGDGDSGVSGVISAANSLVGSSYQDQVGSEGVQLLSNGNYVVRSLSWDNGSASDAGAVTWGNGSSGISGPVSAENSLVGGATNDEVGSWGITPLDNGNFVVNSPFWDDGSVPDAGAVTWGDGNSGITGPVSPANSLVGETAGDRVGFASVTPLRNGRYVVASSRWDNGAVPDAGAVTWGDGNSGIVGAVSSANSLVGGAPGDQVGSLGAAALSDGNYVVSSPEWANGAVEGAGAVTWQNGTTGGAGLVSSANSLVGGASADHVGSQGVVPLSNGHYVVRSPEWDNGAAWDAGAATWGNGAGGTTGVVSAANSLVGGTADDRVGDFDWVTALNNGNYLVNTPLWDNGAVMDAGALTWGDGTRGVSGVVSAANSLVGSAPEDWTGAYNSVTVLSNGNYVVSNDHWDLGAAVDAGAVTWGDGTGGICGAISAANSLVGSAMDDNVGSEGVTVLSNGDYVVWSRFWNGVGAITWGDGAGGVSGPITARNSVRGEAVGGGRSMVFQYDAVNNQIVVGRPADNIVTLFKLVPEVNIYMPIILR